MRAILERCLLGMVLAWGIAGTVVADDAMAPAEPTPGDRVAASSTTKSLKRFSERLGASVGGALDKAGTATGRAGTAVSGAFDAADSKMTGWLGRLGFKPAEEETRGSRPGREGRGD